MRLMFAVVAVVVAGSWDSNAADDPYRWCANYRNGSSNCYFVTHKQCRETLAGVGGVCVRNPYYNGPDAPSRVTIKKEIRTR
jgi:hypothetical protein